MGIQGEYGIKQGILRVYFFRTASYLNWKKSHITMMGEFIIYYRGKIVGGIYDDSTC